MAFIKYIIRYFHPLGYFFALVCFFARVCFHALDDMGKIGRVSKKPSNKVKIYYKNNILRSISGFLNWVSYVIVST